MHRAALAYVGLEGDYVTRDVDESGFLCGVAEIRSGSLDGANVTMPLKLRAHEMSDVVSDRAARVGAVNTLSIESGKLTGHNTDVEGVSYAFEMADLPTTGPVVVLGAGGAAAAAQVALVDRELYVVARRPEQAESVVERLGSEAGVIPWGDPVPAGVVVNATSLGMRGELLPEYILDSATGLLDMAYGEAPTRSVAALRSRGLPVADGLDMLVGQAVGCFRIWTGEDVAPVVFRNAAEAAVRHHSPEDRQC
jgi:shikimate dehydrogenase